MTRATAVHSDLRLFRERAALRQEELAERAGVSRQALSALEAGRAAPSTVVALRLARALGRRVEELFRLDERPAALRARIVPSAEGARSGTLRVALARVGESWVAHPLDAEPADGAAVAADGIVVPVQLPGSSAPSPTAGEAGEPSRVFRPRALVRRGSATPPRSLRARPRSGQIGRAHV